MTPLCDKDNPDNVHSALAVLGDKWSALILKLLHEGPKRFKDFESALDGISPRTLSQRLDRLLEQQIICQETCPDSPGYCEYVLTDKGKALDPVIHAMAKWGHRYG
jgi:DNA-binding HxlR family transcriptional regulator